MCVCVCVCVPTTPVESCHRRSCSHLRRLRPHRSLRRHQSLRTSETHLLMLLYLKIIEEIEADDVRDYLDACGRKEVIIDPSVRNL